MDLNIFVYSIPFLYERIYFYFLFFFHLKELMIDLSDIWLTWLTILGTGEIYFNIIYPFSKMKTFGLSEPNLSHQEQDIHVLLNLVSYFSHKKDTPIYYLIHHVRRNRNMLIS